MQQPQPHMYSAPAPMPVPSPVQYSPAPVAAAGSVVTLGDQPQMVVCPKCARQVTTATELETGCWTYLSAWLLTGLCCSCWVPFCCDSRTTKFKDVKHTCPNCRSTIGTLKRINLD